MLRIMAVATLSALYRDLWPVGAFAALGFFALGAPRPSRLFVRLSGSRADLHIGDPTFSPMVRSLPAE